MTTDNSQNPIVAANKSIVAKMVPKLNPSVKCQFCTRSFTSMSANTAHGNKYHKELILDVWKPCLPCKKYFPTEINLATHNGQKHKTGELKLRIAPVRCQYCLQFSISLFNLRKHCLIHHKEKMNQDWLNCSACTLTFPDEVSLSRHTKRVHKTGKARSKFFDKCEFCDKSFLKISPIEMYKHCSSKHTDKIENHWIICAVCAIYFPRDKINIHSANAHLQRKCQTIQCNHCPRLISAKSYITHSNSYHRETVSKEWHKCNSCNKFFPTLEELHKHGKSHKKLECPFCHRVFLHKTLQTHVYKTHYEEARMTWLICTTCRCMFQSENERMEHICSVSQFTETQCEYCPKIFGTTEAYICHANNTHQNEIIKQWLKCTSCSEYFPSKTFLDSHKCPLYKMLKCEFNCQEIFKSSSVLVNHVNKHHLQHLKDSSWLSCSHCEWFCPTKFILHYHIKNVHQIDSGKYTCNHCEKKFSRKSCLKKHTRLTHSLTLSTKTCRCSDCNTIFDSFKSLAQHQKKEHTMSKFECALCTCKYGSKVSLSLQVELKHPCSKCLSCAMNFVSIQDLESHISVTNHKALHHKKCLFCGLAIRKTLYVQHANEKHEKNISARWKKCNVCLYYAPSNKILEKHTKCHKDCNNSKKQCEFCPLKVNLDQYRNHAHNYHINEIALAWPKCIDCNIYFPSTQLLSEHQQANLCHDYFSCQFCPLKFVSKSLLSKHCNAKHTVDISTRWQECMLCHKYFPDKTCLEAHIHAAHFTTFRVPCRFCEKTFSSYIGYTKHGKEYHTEEVMEKWLSCQACNMHLPTNEILKEHQVRVHKIKSDNLNEMPCKHCGELVEITSNVSHLNSKHRTQISKTWPRCDKCYWSFPTRDFLTAHQRGCGENSTDHVKCQFCTDKFLKGHVTSQAEHMTISHKDEASKEYYLCSDCKIFYPSIPTLQSHKRYIHGKTITSDDLSYHLNSNNQGVFPENWAKCPTCNWHYSSEDQLISHIWYCLGMSDRHDGASECVPHIPCDFCPEMFEKASIQKYYKHTRDFHNNELKSRKHWCLKCLRLYPSEKYLEIHERSHRIANEKSKTRSDEVAEIQPSTLVNVPLDTHSSKTVSKKKNLASRTSLNMTSKWLHIRLSKNEINSWFCCSICDLYLEAENMLVKHWNDNHPDDDLPYSKRLKTKDQTLSSATTEPTSPTLLCHNDPQSYMSDSKSKQQIDECFIDFESSDVFLNHPSLVHPDFAMELSDENMITTSQLEIRRFNSLAAESQHIPENDKKIVQSPTDPSSEKEQLMETVPKTTISKTPIAITLGTATTSTIATANQIIKQEQIQCLLCSSTSTFSSYYGYQRHLGLQHFRQQIADTYLPSKSVAPFSCGICQIGTGQEMSFNFETFLIIHLATSHNCCIDFADENLEMQLRDLPNENQSASLLSTE